MDFNYRLHIQLFFGNKISRSGVKIKSKRKKTTKHTQICENGKKNVAIKSLSHTHALVQNSMFKLIKIFVLITFTIYRSSFFDFWSITQKKNWRKTDWNQLSSPVPWILFCFLKRISYILWSSSLLSLSLFPIRAERQKDCMVFFFLIWHLCGCVPMQSVQSIGPSKIFCGKLFHMLLFIIRFGEHLVEKFANWCRSWASTKIWSIKLFKMASKLKSMIIIPGFNCFWKFIQNKKKKKVSCHK